MKKTKKELIKIHKELHQSLDILISCYIQNQQKLLIETNLVDFMTWSHKQTLNPKCYSKQ